MKYDEKFPHTYLDKSIENILKPLNISRWVCRMLWQIY